MEKDLEQRTKRFSLAVLKLCSALPTRSRFGHFGQAINSLGHFDWRELSRGEPRGLTVRFSEQDRNRAEGGGGDAVLLELLIESGLADDSARETHSESSELLAIFTAIGKRLGDANP